MKTLFIPLGRLSELLAGKDAGLIAYSVQGYDAKIRRFSSRAALLTFCKPDSRLNALVKDVLPSDNYITNRNTQTA